MFIFKTTTKWLHAHAPYSMRHALCTLHCLDFKVLMIIMKCLTEENNPKETIECRFTNITVKNAVRILSA